VISQAVRFFEAIEGRDLLSDRELTAYFLYLVTVEQGQQAATAKDINDCFSTCDLKVPSRTAAYLSEGTKSKPPLYVKVPRGGYRLHRVKSDEISGALGSRRVVSQTSAELRSLEASFPEGPKKKFLAETVDCFEANANRAAIIMSWILTLDHLFDFVLKHHLSSFNAALAANPDKKMKYIVNKDDFSELKEVKIVELCRAAGIVSNDVRKILEDALGVRNTAAHPSGVEVSRNKAVALIEDLVLNVISKYKI
jgi:hypothetical protein